MQKKRPGRSGSQQIDPLRRVLSGLIRDRNMEERLDLHQVFLFWEKAVGRDIAVHAKPDVIHGTVLWLVVADSMWMHHLHLQKPLILERINARLQGVSISDLRFRVGDVAEEEMPDRSVKPKRVLRPLTAMPEELAREISEMSDDNMRHAFVSLWRKASSSQDGSMK